jgi:cytochrome c biogenesis factor
MTTKRGARTPKPNGRVAYGLLLVGLGKPAGFAQFGGSAEAFLASLAPLLGFLIVLSLVLVWSGRLILGVSFFLTMVCDLLAPAVISDVLCRVWKRHERWARYANVLNCTQWLMAAALVVLVPIEAVCVSAGRHLQVGAGAVLLVFCVYLMWFHWFAARHVLDLSSAKALLMMLAVVFGTGLLLQVPLVIGTWNGMHGATQPIGALTK